MKFARRLFPSLLPLIWAFGFVPSLKADPPARIGRINYVSGQVSLERGDLDEWVPAMINYPMIAGDHLWTDNHARAELHVGSTTIRLAPQTEFAFLNLDDQTLQIRLSEGSLNVRVRALGEDDVFEVDTPNTAISLLRPGEYRIDVDMDGNTNVTAWHGEVEVTSAGSAFPVRSRERALIKGSDLPTYDLVEAPRPDDFDDWAAARDRREDRAAAAAHYVSREMVGYEDLHEYGTWQVHPVYGNIWVPATVPVGWAPYRYGHWVWIEPWGWTWIDDAPWGFAPFHYGRWAYINGVWYWVPGAPVARPVYAPALVAFLGGRWSLTLSFGGGGGVAWFPLAPGEVYVPAYRVSETYVRNVNVSNVNIKNINVTNINVTKVNYINRTIPGSVTAVPQAVFTSAHPVGGAAVVVPAHAVATASVAGMTATIAPSRTSLVTRPAAANPASVAHPPVYVQNRTVVAKTAPPAPPVPFYARQGALMANPGRPLDESALARVRQSIPGPQTVNQTVRPASPANNPTEGLVPFLRPARKGLPVPHPVSIQGFTPTTHGTPAPRSEAKPEVQPIESKTKPRTGEKPQHLGRPAPPQPEHAFRPEGNEKPNRPETKPKKDTKPKSKQE